MCGRYTLTDTSHLGARFNIAKVPKDLHENYNIAPTQVMPVITQSADGRQLELMRWGIPRFIGPGKVKDVFNTRSDKAFGSWKKLVSSQRILVPATGFYEWKTTPDGKHPYFIRPKGEALFSFAGIWIIWKDDNNKQIKTYSIMTTEPNQEMSSIHSRMPVILDPENESDWLAPSHNDDKSVIESLLHPYHDNGLQVYEVSTAVNSVRNNDARLIEALH